jgi:hypothetical protein
MEVFAEQEGARIASSGQQEKARKQSHQRKQSKGSPGLRSGGTRSSKGTIVGTGNGRRLSQEVAMGRGSISNPLSMPSAGSASTWQVMERAAICSLFERFFPEKATALGRSSINGFPDFIFRERGRLGSEVANWNQVRFLFLNRLLLSIEPHVSHILFPTPGGILHAQVQKDGPVLPNGGVQLGCGRQVKRLLFS